MIEQINHLAHSWWDWMSAMFWQVGLLIVLIATIDLLIRKWAWPQLRYALWSLVLIKLVLSPTLSLPSGLAPKVKPVVTQMLESATQKELIEFTMPIVIPSADEVEGQWEMDDGRETKVEGHTVYIDSTAGPLIIYQDSVESPAKTTNERRETKNEGRQVIAEIRPSSFRPSSIVIPTGPRLGWRAYIMGIWFLGVVTLGTWLFVKLNRLKKEKSNGSKQLSLPESFYNQLDRCAQQLKLRRKPRVVTTASIRSPAVFGMVHPVLLMPVGYIRGLSRRDTEYMLLHELAHIKRGDLAAHSLCMLLRLVYWYNPLLWIVGRQLRHLRELCCDATVASLLRDKTSEYRQTLLETARRFLATPVEPGLGLVGLFEDSNRLIARIQWLKKPVWRYRKMKSIAVLTTILILLACVLPMAQGQNPQAEEPNVSTEQTEAQSTQSQELLTESEETLETEQKKKEQQQKQLQALQQLKEEQQKQLEAMQQLMARLKQIDLEKQKLQKELQALMQARSDVTEASMEATFAKDNAAKASTEAKFANDNATKASMKAKEAKDKALKATMMAQEAKDKVAKIKAKKGNAEAQINDKELRQAEDEAKKAEQAAKQAYEELRKTEEEVKRWKHLKKKTHVKTKESLVLPRPTPMPNPTPRPTPVEVDVVKEVELDVKVEVTDTPEVSEVFVPKPPAPTTIVTPVTPTAPMSPPTVPAPTDIVAPVPPTVSIAVPTPPEPPRVVAPITPVSPAPPTVSVAITPVAPTSVPAPPAPQASPAPLSITVPVTPAPSVMPLTPPTPAIPVHVDPPAPATPSSSSLPLLGSVDETVIPSPDVPVSTPPTSSATAYSSERRISNVLITENFVDSDLVKDVFPALSKKADIPIILEKTVSGLITCKLEEVPFEKALDIILAGTPYIYKKTPNYYLVLKGRKGLHSTNNLTLTSETVSPAPAAPKPRPKPSRDVKIGRTKDGKYVAITEMHLVSKVNPGSPFVIRNSLGNILLKQSKDNTCDVKAVVRAEAETADKAQEMAEEVGMQIDTSKEKYFLKPIKPDDNQWSNLSVNLTILVPVGVRPDVKTELGNVELWNLRGKIKAVSELGSIKAINTTGDLELLTKMGEIVFNPPKDLSAKLRAETKMGSIKSDLPLNINKKDMFKRTAEGAIGSGRDTIRMTTNMGSITITNKPPKFPGNNPEPMMPRDDILDSADKLKSQQIQLEAMASKIAGTVQSIKEEQEGNRFVLKRIETTTAPLAPGSVLDITNEDGNITVQGSDTDQCSITSTFTIKAPTTEQARDLSEKISLQTTPGDKKLTVKTVGPRRTPSYHMYYVNMLISVPRNTTVTMRKEDGDIQITHLEGQIQVGSEDGNITCENVSGDARVTSEDGDITFKNISGNARITSEDGNVNIKESHLTQLNIKKEDGNIHCDEISGNCDITIEDGNVTIGYAEGSNDNSTCIVRGEDGNVRISRGVFAKCQVNRESGDVRCDNVKGNLDVKLEEGQVTMHYADSVPENCSIKAQLEEGSIKLSAPNEMFPADAPSKPKRRGEGMEWKTTSGNRSVSLRVDEGAVKVEKR